MIHPRIQIWLQEGMQMSQEGSTHGLPALVHCIGARQAARHQVGRLLHALLTGLECKVLHKCQTDIICPPTFCVPALISCSIVACT